MLKIIIYLITSYTLITSAYALNNRMASDIIINSDNLVFDKTKDVASFEGEVIIWFEDMRLKTSKLKIFYKKVAGKNKIDKIIIPDKLKALNEKSKDVLIADSAEYIFDKSQLTLQGRVYLLHKENILKANKLVYISKLMNIDHKK